MPHKVIKILLTQNNDSDGNSKVKLLFFPACKRVNTEIETNFKIADTLNLTMMLVE